MLIFFLGLVGETLWDEAVCDMIVDYVDDMKQPVEDMVKEQEVEKEVIMIRL